MGSSEYGSILAVEVLDIEGGKEVAEFSEGSGHVSLKVVGRIDVFS